MVIVYVGGLNVLFAYFVAIAPNQFFSSFNLRFSGLASGRSFFFFFLFYPIFFDHIEFSSMDILKLFLGRDRAILFFLVVVLFLALVAVVKVASRYEGALRPFI